MDTAPKNNVQEGKPRPSLLPMDVMIKHVCPAYSEGVLKYERESWRKGFLVSNMIDAAYRHISAFYHGGEDYDPDAEKHGVKKHHLAGAIFSLLSILHTMDTRPELDDRPKPTHIAENGSTDKYTDGHPIVGDHLPFTWMG